MIRVPLLTPRLSSLWLSLVTPVHARVGRKLIESIRHPSVVRDPSAAALFSIEPTSVEESIVRALREEDDATSKPHWYGAVAARGARRTWAGVRFGNRFVDSRSVTVAVTPERAFRPIRRIGGKNGWYALDWLWRIRGFLDVLIGGCGLRRGRTNSEQPVVGDEIDCWHVEEFEPNRRLRLRADMKLPGRAWLEFEVEGSGASSTVRQTAIFDPLGLGGLTYWYTVCPLHALVFDGMLDEIARRSLLAEDGATLGTNSPPIPR
jgi:hypothetical protein